MIIWRPIIFPFQILFSICYTDQYYDDFWNYIFISLKNNIKRLSRLLGNRINNTIDVIHRLIIHFIYKKVSYEFCLHILMGNIDFIHSYIVKD